MIYDKLPVSLLTALSTEESDSPYAQLASYVLLHAGEVHELSVRELAEACHVGMGTVSRFARDVGFADFGELREEFARTSQSFERVAGSSIGERAQALAQGIAGSLTQASATLNMAALRELANDLATYDKISTFGLLKAQSAAVELQVGMLMQGRLVYTCSSAVDQFAHIERASADELVVVFSYTGGYFDAHDIGRALRRRDLPRIWMVCGTQCPLPPFVYSQLCFTSKLDQLSHPYQLQFVASLLAQEYATIIKDLNRSGSGPNL